MLNQAIDVFANRWTVGFDVLRFLIELTRFQRKWWISDLIPKKSEKFEFRKKFFIMFFGVEN